MLLFIDDTKTISDLQDKFNECFPFLHIEFYEHDNLKNKGTSGLHPNTLLQDLRKKHTEGILEIKSWFRIEKVEQDFRNRYDLDVVIFRRYKNHWIPANDQPHLTLKEQSELAEASVPKTKPQSLLEEGEEEIQQ